MSETRALTLHENIIKDIIFRQAGTRDKAVLEGIMNCIDAHAQRIVIDVSRTGVTIADDGDGFATRDAILSNFERFGTPHEAGDATFGRYRMGRGQLFAFGKNEWRSHTFRMRIDAKAALSYDLEEGLLDVVGCTVNVRWYEELGTWELGQLCDTIKKQIQFVEIPIVLNGALVTNPDVKWDLITEYARIKFRDTGNLAVYNQGVWVRDYPNTQFGTGGVVVSTKALEVNFARNDVMSACPIWKKVTRQLLGKVRATPRKDRDLSEHEQQFLIDEIRSEEPSLDWDEVSKARIFVDVTGKAWCHQDIVKHLRKHGIAYLTMADPGDPFGDSAHSARQAFCFANTLLDRFQYDTPEEWFKGLARLGFEWPGQIIRISALEQRESKGFKVLPREQWTPLEARVIECIGGASHWLWKLAQLTDGHERTIQIGMTQGTDAWTDGKDTITLNRQSLREWGTDVYGFAMLASVLAHEYCHGDSTTEKHVHGREFYERYHDAYPYQARLVAALIDNWPKVLTRAKRRLNRQAARMADLEIRRYRLEADAAIAQTLVAEATALRERARA